MPPMWCCHSQRSVSPALPNNRPVNLPRPAGSRAHVFGRLTTRDVSQGSDDTRAMRQIFGSSLSSDATPVETSQTSNPVDLPRPVGRRSRLFGRLTNRDASKGSEVIQAMDQVSGPFLSNEATPLETAQTPNLVDLPRPVGRRSRLFGRLTTRNTSKGSEDMQAVEPASGPSIPIEATPVESSATKNLVDLPRPFGSRSRVFRRLTIRNTSKGSEDMQAKRQTSGPSLSSEATPVESSPNTKLCETVPISNPRRKESSSRLHEVASRIKRRLSRDSTASKKSSTGKLRIELSTDDNKRQQELERVMHRTLEEDLLADKSVSEGGYDTDAACIETPKLTIIPDSPLLPISIQELSEALPQLEEDLNNHDPVTSTTEPRGQSTGENLTTTASNPNEDADNRSVHLYDMRISYYLRSRSLLSSVSLPDLASPYASQVGIGYSASALASTLSLHLPTTSTSSSSVMLDAVPSPPNQQLRDTTSSYYDSDNESLAASSGSPHICTLSIQSAVDNAEARDTHTSETRSASPVFTEGIIINNAADWIPEETNQLRPYSPSIYSTTESSKHEQFVASNLHLNTADDHVQTPKASTFQHSSSDTAEDDSLTPKASTFQHSRSDTPEDGSPTPKASRIQRLRHDATRDDSPMPDGCKPQQPRFHTTGDDSPMTDASRFQHSYLDTADDGSPTPKASKLQQLHFDTARDDSPMPEACRVRQLRFDTDEYGSPTPKASRFKELYDSSEDGSPTPKASRFQKLHLDTAEDGYTAEEKSSTPKASRFQHLRLDTTEQGYTAEDGSPTPKANTFHQLNLDTAEDRYTAEDGSPTPNTSKFRGLGFLTPEVYLTTPKASRFQELPNTPKDGSPTPNASRIRKLRFDPPTPKHSPATPNANTFRDDLEQSSIQTPAKNLHRVSIASLDGIREHDLTTKRQGFGRVLFTEPFAEDASIAWERALRNHADDQAGRSRARDESVSKELASESLFWRNKREAATKAGESLRSLGGLPDRPARRSLDSIWARFPSHDRQGRSFSPAGEREGVAVRDFAPGGGSPARAIKKTRSMGDMLRAFARRHERQTRMSPGGHRSSIAPGGILEYPELELVAPATPFVASPSPAPAPAADPAPTAPEEDWSVSPSLPAPAPQPNLPAATSEGFAAQYADCVEDPSEVAEAHLQRGLMFAETVALRQQVNAILAEEMALGLWEGDFI